MSRPPHALALTWHHPRSSERLVVDHVEGLVARGWRVTVACVELDETALAGRPVLAEQTRTVVLGEVLDRTPLGRLRSLVAAGELRSTRSATARRAARIAWPLRRLVAEVRPDLVHGHGTTNGAAAALACGTTGPPVVADLHGFDLDDRPGSEGWGPTRRLLADAAIITHSAYAAGQVRGGTGLDATVVRHGTPASFWSPVRTGCWPRPLRLLVVARLVQDKGVDLAVQAVAELARELPQLDPRLTILGGGPDEGSVRDFVRVFGAEQRVTFAGARDEDGVAATMRAHDILLVPHREADPGRREPSERVAAEGLASGLAVVASASGGLPEALDGAGHLVPPDDPTALTGALRRLLAESSPAGEVARARAAGAVHPLEETWDAYDRLGRSLVEARRRRPDSRT